MNFEKIPKILCFDKERNAIEVLLNQSTDSIDFRNSNNDSFSSWIILNSKDERLNSNKFHNRIKKTFDKKDNKIDNEINSNNKSSFNKNSVHNFEKNENNNLQSSNSNESLKKRELNLISQRNENLGELKKKIILKEENNEEGLILKENLYKKIYNKNFTFFNSQRNETQLRNIKKIKLEENYLYQFAHNEKKIVLPTLAKNKRYQTVNNDNHFNFEKQKNSSYLIKSNNNVLKKCSLFDKNIENTAKEIEKIIEKNKIPKQFSNKIRNNLTFAYGIKKSIQTILNKKSELDKKFNNIYKEDLF